MAETIYRKLKELKKLPNNPRTILDDDFKRLCASVQNNADYFKARPLILSDRTGELVIIAGNQRYEAAKRLKLQEVPTHLIEHLTEDREREIIIRDNVANGQWDFDAIANEWSDLPLEDWGLSVPGFETVEGESGESSDEGINYQSQYGVIVMCGNETEQQAVFEKLTDEGLTCKIVVT